MAPKKTVKKKKAKKAELKAGYIAIPEKTYFYQRKDGSVFPVSAKEASLIHGNVKFTQYGVSDGAAYCKAVNDLQKKKGLTRAMVSKALALALKDEMKKAKGKLEAPPDMRFSQFGNITIGQSTISEILKS